MKDWVNHFYPTKRLKEFTFKYIFFSYDNMKKQQYYFPDLPWSIIKSFNLTFDKTRATKSAKLMKEYCNSYEEMINDNEILPETSFSFVYFYSMMKYRSHFNYALFPTYTANQIQWPPLI
jgi:hypothetical protein